MGEARRRRDLERIPELKGVDLLVYRTECTDAWELSVVLDDITNAAKEANPLWLGFVIALPRGESMEHMTEDSARALYEELKERFEMTHDRRRLEKGLAVLRDSEATREAIDDAIAALQSTDDPDPAYSQTHDALCERLKELEEPPSKL